MYMSFWKEIERKQNYRMIDIIFTTRMEKLGCSKKKQIHEMFIKGVLPSVGSTLGDGLGEEFS